MPIGQGCGYPRFLRKLPFRSRVKRSQDPTTGVAKATIFFFFFTDFTSRPIETYFPRIKRTVYRHACSGYSVQKYRILSIFDEECISRVGPLTEGLGNGNPLLRGRNYGSLTYRTYTPRNEVWAKERNDKTQRPPKDDGHRNPWEMARKYLLSHVGIPTLALLDCGGEGTHVENHILFVVSLHFSSAPRKKEGGGVNTSQHFARRSESMDRSQALWCSLALLR